MTTFELKLPEELRLSIFRRVSTQDALKLAIVCRTFRTSAEQVLYETISNVQYMNRLYRTLVVRPDLASLVKSIDLCPLMLESPVPAVVDHGCSVGMTDNDYRFDLPITENRIAGLILRALPALESLKISILYLEDRRLYTEEGYDDLAWQSAHPIIAVLGPAYHPSNGNHTTLLSQIPGLKNLKDLTYCGARFPSSLGSLPNLENVHLSRDCFFMDDPKQDASVLDPDLTRSKYRYLESCLKQYICLKTLTIDILEQERVTRHGDVSTLLDRLRDVQGHIEMMNLIVVQPHEGLHYLNLVLPVPSMTAFSGLKKLSMPYEWIEKVDNETIVMTVFSKVFPQTLEVLELQIPQEHTCAWLLEFANQRSKSNFIHLREFRLYCSEMRGVGYEKFRYDSRYATQVKDIGKTGIHVEVSYHPDEYKPEWDNEDYDPISKSVVDELRSLSVSYQAG
ncbi:uncharacterized protein N0V89_011740 [Didymosphaeria variabile]|uniref:F-box domain-containing protein n=1 Tax=Didymosphaeria variabile TaxID=1932322 RepID=A0A9W8XAA8_9PLEO|nr:uncharacterized protein N0V89_011740 [Didymosphaeria variabile]KAJ4345607.1 hypothetical protein N0V89_011740 [Didymosphaeria variabile]